MELNPVQDKLLGFISKNDGDISDFSLREIGEEIGVGRRAQVIAHHLGQLEKRGLIHKHASNPKLYSFNKLPENDTVSLPLYESTAECGHIGARLGEDTIETHVPISRKAFHITNPEQYFLIKARGKSMEPVISSGDLVLIRKQPDFETGKISLVVHNDEPKIKNVVVLEVAQKKFIALKSFNQGIPEEIIDESTNMRMIGIVKGIIKNL